MNNIKNVLCFTTSYNRFKMLRECIFSIKNQSYPTITHSVNVVNDGKNSDYDIVEVLNDLSLNGLMLNFNTNSTQHINYINSLTQNINPDYYDLFIKIDDDDIYKMDYVKTIVSYFEENAMADVITSKVSLVLNGDYIYKTEQYNLGGHENLVQTFNMPMTMAFNRKAYNQLLAIESTGIYEDITWREVWDKTCNLQIVDNSDNFIWHIHGKNISTGDLLKT